MLIIRRCLEKSSQDLADTDLLFLMLPWTGQAHSRSSAL